MAGGLTTVARKLFVDASPWDPRHSDANVVARTKHIFWAIIIAGGVAVAIYYLTMENYKIENPWDLDEDAQMGMSCFSAVMIGAAAFVASYLFLQSVYKDPKTKQDAMNEIRKREERVAAYEHDFLQEARVAGSSASSNAEEVD